MSEQAKRVGAICLIVVCVGVLVFLGYKMFAPPILETGVVHASPAKSMAQLEKEREQRENAGASGGQIMPGGSGAATERGDDDSSGRLAGSR